MTNREGEVEGTQSEFNVDDEDQLQPEDTLLDNGVDDVLDNGIAPADRPAAVDKVGLTAREQEEGETLDQRLAEEVPDAGPDDPVGAPHSLEEAVEEADIEAGDPDAPSGDDIAEELP